MTVFIALAVYLIIVYLIIPESHKTLKSVLCAIALTSILVLRSPIVGQDVTGNSTGIIEPNSYAGVFLRIPNYTFFELLTVQSHMEVGWLFLTKFISLFTNNLQFFLAIIAILQFIPIAFVVAKYSNNVVLSYIIFASLGLYVLYFSGLRQMLAVSLLLLSFDRLINKKYGWFVFITIIASTIHTSALFFLIMWPLSYLQITFFSALLFMLVTIGIMPFYNIIIPKIFALMPSLSYSGYLNEGGQAITMFVAYLILFLSSFLLKKKDRLTNILRLLLLVGVISQSLGMIGGGSITRIAFYFLVYLMLLLPRVVESFGSRNEKTIINIISVVLLFSYFVLTTKEGPGSVIPYKFYWEISLFS